MTDRDEDETRARRAPEASAQEALDAMRAPDGGWTDAHRAALDAYAREIEREGVALSGYRSF